MIDQDTLTCLEAERDRHERAAARLRDNLHHQTRDKSQGNREVSSGRYASLVGGPQCFSSRIHSHTFPERFCVCNIEKYNGDTKPNICLVDYLVIVDTANGDETHVMRHLPLMLTDLAKAWLNNLPANCIHDLKDLQREFIRNFSGTYKMPGSSWYLDNVIQKDGELARDYIKCWTKEKNSMDDVLEEQAIHAFSSGLRYKELKAKLF